MRAASAFVPGFAPPRSGWGAWRALRPRVTYRRDSDPDEWAWEAVGLEKEPDPPRSDWLFLGLILMLTSCPAFALGLLVLLDG